MQKWQIKNPLNCDFCTIFWASFGYILGSNLILFNGIDYFEFLFKILIYALSSAVLGFYILIRINMYANNR